MSETLRDLVVSLSLNCDNFTRNIRSVQKQIQEAQSSFKLASAGVADFEKTAAGLSTKLDTLKRTPVSYTHLDVYKRQRLDAAPDRAGSAAAFPAGCG